MARFYETVRAYPGRWVGVSTGFNKEIVDFFKQMPVRAWDAATKTWWFPESSEPLLSAELVRSGVITREQAAAFSKKFYDHQKLGTADEPYAILGLRVGAPRGMIDLAYQFWRRQYQNAGGTGTQLEEVEAAYAAIIAGTL